ncbi:MAG: hypothetical protein IPJ65_27310 [Archangiaceae bacterium]|nr:hypothetical protein [Archangiaceae bacterium]
MTVAGESTEISVVLPIVTGCDGRIGSPRGEATVYDGNNIKIETSSVLVEWLRTDSALRQRFDFVASEVGDYFVDSVFLPMFGRVQTSIVVGRVGSPGLPGLPAFQFDARGLAGCVDYVVLEGHVLCFDGVSLHDVAVGHSVSIGVDAVASVGGEVWVAVGEVVSQVTIGSDDGLVLSEVYRCYGKIRDLFANEHSLLLRTDAELLHLRLLGYGVLNGRWSFAPQSVIRSWLGSADDFAVVVEDDGQVDSFSVCRFSTSSRLVCSPQAGRLLAVASKGWWSFGRDGHLMFSAVRGERDEGDWNSLLPCVWQSSPGRFGQPRLSGAPCEVSGEWFLRSDLDSHGMPERWGRPGDRVRMALGGEMIVATSASTVLVYQSP